MTYELLCDKENSLITLIDMREKDGLKNKMKIIVHIMAYPLLCDKDNSLIIVD